MEGGVVLVSALVFLSVTQAAWMLISPGEEDMTVVQKRLASYAVRRWQIGMAQGVSVTRRRQYSRFPLLDAILSRLDLADKMGRQLQQAGVPLRAGEFLFAQLLVATLVSGIALVALGGIVGSLIAAAGGALVGFVLPPIWLKMKRGKRVSDFEYGLPDVLDLIAASLRAGYGLAHGLDTVAREGTGPCAEEFGQVLLELNLGRDLDVALAAMTERMDSEDAKLLATAIAVQRRTGGNLIEVFSQMAIVLRDRQQLRRDVHVITTAPRVSGYVVAALPLATMAFMYLTARYYVDVLLSETIGHLALIACVILVSIGLYLNRKIANVEM